MPCRIQSKVFLRNARKTERGAKQLPIRMESFTLPFSSKAIPTGIRRGARFKSSLPHRGTLSQTHY